MGKREKALTTFTLWQLTGVMKFLTVLLTRRIIKAPLGEVHMARDINRGLTQGGVFSYLLCNNRIRGSYYAETWYYTYNRAVGKIWGFKPIIT